MLKTIYFSNFLQLEGIGMQTKKLRASAVAWLLLMPLFMGLLFIGGTGSAVTLSLDETSWTKGTIDSESDVSNVISEAIDLDGYLHVSYYDTFGQNLMYATNSDGAWMTEVVDSSANVGKYNSIAVDSSGKVHISYYDATNNDLKYATGNLDSWSISVVDSTGVVGEYNSIAIGSGSVYITYLDYSNDALKYAVKSGNSWSTALAIEDVGFGNSLMFTDGKLQVAYISQDNELCYASLNGSEWTSEVVDSGSSFGVEIDIDAMGERPCVAYYDEISRDLKLAIRGTSGVWSKQIVDDTTNVNSWLSLDIDSMNRFHITYYDMSNQDLCYAYFNDDWSFWVLDTSGGVCSAMVSDYNNKQHVVYIDLVDASAQLSYITNSGAKWVLETVDEDGLVGEQSSIAVDADGFIHMAYYDNSNGSLNYANNVDGWNVVTIDNTTPMVGLFPSIALDADGNVHISYYDMTGSRILKYATNQDGDWDIRTLDGSGDVGLYSSIAIDGNGSVHIAYLNHASKNLKYTSNAGGDWIIGLIDSSGQVEGRVSLAVDSENMVHVAYYRSGELIHANQIVTGWAIESLETSDQLGGGISMFIDDQDQIYITYYNEVLSLLKYKNNVGGQWNGAQVIEAEGNVGIASSIMVDANGDEHIAYVDQAGSGILKYVEKRNGIWMFQKVDLQGCGDHISMAMDFQGRAHISYYDPVGKDLRYASSVVVPSAPLNLTTTVGDGAVTLNWEAPASNGGANITEYVIYRGTSTNDLVLYDDVSGTANSYSDLGLENGVSWTYRIRAMNSEGSSPYSNAVVGTPCTLPGMPDVDASGQDKAVLLKWNAPDNGGAAITEYRVYRQNETGMFVLIATVGGGETRYTDTGLENGVEYTYQVGAVNPAGPGPWSEKASATANPNNDMVMIIVFIVVIAAVAGAGIFLLMRQKGKI